MTANPINLVVNVYAFWLIFNRQQLPPHMSFKASDPDVIYAHHPASLTKIEVTAQLKRIKRRRAPFIHSDGIFIVRPLIMKWNHGWTSRWHFLFHSHNAVITIVVQQSESLHEALAFRIVRAGGVEKFIFAHKQQLEGDLNFFSSRKDVNEFFPEFSASWDANFLIKLKSALAVHRSAIDFSRKRSANESMASNLRNRFEKFV